MVVLDWVSRSWNRVVDGKAQGTKDETIGYFCLFPFYLQSAIDLFSWRKSPAWADCIAWPPERSWRSMGRKIPASEEDSSPWRNFGKGSCFLRRLEGGASMYSGKGIKIPTAARSCSSTRTFLSARFYRFCVTTFMCCPYEGTESRWYGPQNVS